MINLVNLHRKKHFDKQRHDDGVFMQTFDPKTVWYSEGKKIASVPSSRFGVFERADENIDNHYRWNYALCIDHYSQGHYMSVSFSAAHRLVEWKLVVILIKTSLSWAEPSSAHKFKIVIQPNQDVYQMIL